MRLWTIQPKELYLEVLNKGYAICNESLAPDLIDNSFRKPYNYIVKLMERQGIKRPNGVKYPIWAWHTYDGRHHKPDLRHSAFGRRGDKMLCIELEVPDNEVLLTDYDAWHFVLNDSYLDTSLNEEEYDRQHDWFDGLPYDKREKVKVNSWQRIMRIDKFKNEWTARGFYVQATFFVLKNEYIIKAQEFTCR